MTRRQLGRMAAGSAMLAQGTAWAAAKYTGALDSFEDKVNLAAFDPVAYSRRLYESAPLRMTFRAENRKQAEAWQKKLRPKMAELIGLQAREKAPIKPLTLEVREFPGYRREKVVFESAPGLTVLAYLLTPVEAKAPLPVVVCVPGHGRGVDDIVGIDAEGRDRTNKDGYQHDFAIQTVEKGLAAVAIEPIAFGCRRDPITKKRPLTASACQPAAGAALLLGQTMIAWRVYDVMRTIDWIEMRKELDATRVGCMGISGGGTCTLFSAALEPRIRAAMVSGYLNTFKDSVFSLSHCIDNYVPGILNWAEMYDVAGLVTPRALFCESGEKDNIFPLASFRHAVERVKKVYEVFGAAGKFGHEVFPSEHTFHGVGGIPFLKQHLG
ncbi:MAG: alpha/beta hydrolase family protein [Bryobacteraceae bacterium]